MEHNLLEQEVELLLEQYRQEMIERCKGGVRGELKVKVKVKSVNLLVSNVCNCYCVMCPAFSKTHKLDPYVVPLEEIKKILPQKWNDEKIEFSIISAEALLNPDIFEILKYVKEKFPNSEILLMSNGTIPPPTPEIVKYIDIMDFSIDGGVKEVYEKIRTPAKFDHVVEVLKRWVAAKNGYNPKLILQTSTTLSTMNYTDLSNIIKLVADIAESSGTHWNRVCCHPIMIQERQEKWLQETTLDHILPEVGRRVIRDAREMAENHCVDLIIEGAICELFEEKVHRNDKLSTDKSLYMKRFCRGLDNGKISFDINGELETVCCFMDSRYMKELYKEYQIPRKGNPEEIYNSEGYWKLRQDLLEGKLEKQCGLCTCGEADYYYIETLLRKLILTDELERLKSETGTA